MAITVTVLCPNGRRVAVKVTPSTALFKVLEEACLKQRLDPSQHALKHGQKMVDLSALFRYANIPTNAHLEVIPTTGRAQGSVVLAVQCEDGSRPQGKFTDPTTSLWNVLQEVGVVNKGLRGEPVVVYMSTQVCGETALRGRSLRDLGLTNGRAALRFLVRGASAETAPPDESTSPGIVTHPDETAPPGVTTSPDETAPPGVTMPPAGDVTVLEVLKEGGSTEPIAIDTKDDFTMDTDEDQPKLKISPIEPRPLLPAATPTDTTCGLVHRGEQSVGVGLVTDVPRVIAEVCPRERVVYHLDDSLPLPPTDQLPDDFFTVTPRDVHLMQHDLKKQASMEDAPLLTSAMREVLKERRFDSYSRSVVRVHFSDRWVLQGVFTPGESLKALVRFVRDNLADPTLKFHLFTTPPKTILKRGKVTFLEAGFVPAAIVYVGVEGGVDMPTLLSQEVLDSAQSALQAEVAIAGKRGSHTPHSSTDSAHVTPPTKPSNDAKSAESAAISRTVPKWFKLGK